MLWNRRRHDGFATVPKTMALAMKIINDNSGKGQPAGHTLLCLWLRSLDHPYLTIDRERVYARETGLTSARAEGIWRKRMATLVRLGFILAKEGTGGTYHHVTLLNPNVAVARLRDEGHVQDKTWEFFLERVEEIGASDELADAMKYVAEEKAAKEQAAKKTAKKATNKAVRKMAKPKSATVKKTGAKKTTAK